MKTDTSAKLPRGRQTIRKGGSLLGFHGPVSRRIKLWTCDSKPNTMVAQLEHAYFSALACVDRFQERSRTNAASGRFTSPGMKADALQFALHDLLPGLHTALQTIAGAKTALAERKAKGNPQEGDDINELEEAIAAAESAVQAAQEELRVETGVLNERDLENLAASIEQKPRAPWLRRRRDASGTEQIRVVDLEQKVERLATPEEIEQGVYYQSYDEYQKAKLA